MYVRVMYVRVMYVFEHLHVTKFGYVYTCMLASERWCMHMAHLHDLYTRIIKEATHFHTHTHTHTRTHTH